MRVVGDRADEVADLQLEVVEPVARTLADPLHLLGGLGGERALDRVGADRTGAQVRVDPDDVGLAAGEPQELRASPADEDRRAGLLHRLRDPVVLADRVVLTREVERASAPQRSLDDLRAPRRGGRCASPALSYGSPSAS